MAGAEMTSTELIEENRRLRRRVEELTSQLAGHDESGQESGDAHGRRFRRQQLLTQIEFIGDFDLVEATGVDVSEGGVCFDVPVPLPFEMQFKLNGTAHRHRAHIAWVTQLPEGGYRFGFRFVPSEPGPVI